MKRATIIYIIAALLLTSCSITRHIPDGDKLYTGIKKVEFVKADTYAKSEVGKTAVDEVRAALDYAPNGSIAGSSTMRGLPVGLSRYNAI